MTLLCLENASKYFLEKNYDQWRIVMFLNKLLWVSLQRKLVMDYLINVYLEKIREWILVSTVSKLYIYFRDITINLDT